MNTLIRKGEFMQALDIVETAVKAIDSKKGENIEVIGITDLTVLTDYFVIATATSSTQVKAISDEVEYKLDLLGVEPHHIEGRNTSWVCLDYIQSLYTFFISNSVIFIRLSACGKTAKF